MLKTLCYIADRKNFEYIAVSASGRLATRTQNPFGHIPEIEDLERLLKSNLETLSDKKHEEVADLIEAVHQYNETVSVYERVRYIRSLTPELTQKLKEGFANCENRSNVRQRQNFDTLFDMNLKVVKVEKDGE
jgi:hypothetical protein